MSEGTTSFKDVAMNVARDPSGTIFSGYTAAGPAPDGATYFHAMIKRTRQMFARRTVTRTMKDDEGNWNKSPYPPSERPTVIRIVTVSSYLDLYEGAKLRLEQMRDGCVTLRAQAGFDADEWAEHRLKELKAAVAQHPNVICFPEFGYPPPPPAREGGWTIEEIDDTVGRRTGFERDALKLLGDKDIFLCLGSFHCLMTLYNVGVIYPWGKHLMGLAEQKMIVADTGALDLHYKFEMTRKDGVKAPIMYRKRFPARRVGEQTRVPAGLGINVFDCQIGRVMVLICSDILDLNQFLAIVELGVSKGDIDFIVIPAYNTGASFGAICRDLSAMAAATVVVANASDRASVKMTPPNIYICGEDVSALQNSTFSERNGILKVKTKKVGKSALTTYEIDTEVLRRTTELHIDRLGLPRGVDQGVK